MPKTTAEEVKTDLEDFNHTRLRNFVLDAIRGCYAVRASKPSYVWSKQQEEADAVMVAVWPEIQRLTEAVNESYSVALENRCERETAWDRCCLSTSRRLKAYARSIASRTTVKDALYRARLDAGEDA